MLCICLALNKLSHCWLNGILSCGHKFITPTFLHCRNKTLPSIEEAWSLPIPAELTSRQGAAAAAAAAADVGSRPASTSSSQNMMGVQHGAVYTPPQYSSGSGAPSGTTGTSGYQPTDSKRRRTDDSPSSATPLFSAQQLSTLHSLQHNQANLNPQQQQLLQHLQQQYELSQQHRPLPDLPDPSLTKDLQVWRSCIYLYKTLMLICL